MFCENKPIKFKKDLSNYYLKSLFLKNVNGNEILKTLMEIKEFYLIALSVVKSNLTEETLLLPFPNLKYLNISDNQIKILKKKHFSNLKFLEKLIFSKMKFYSINTNAFENLINLRDLQLKNCHISYLGENLFSNLNKLRKLTIINSRIIDVNDKDFLKKFKYLEELNFLKSHFEDKKIFSYFDFRLNINLKLVKSEYYTLCCILMRDNPTAICWPQNSDFVTCESLIGKISKKIILHIIVTIAFFGNLFLILKKLINKLKPMNLMELTLMFSDLLLSIYFVCLIIMDWNFRENYMNYDFQWRSGIFCRILEIVASTACLLSNFSLLLITWERYLGIKYLIRTNKKGFKSTILLMFSSVIIAFALSSLPLIFFKVNFF